MYFCVLNKIIIQQLIEIDTQLFLFLNGIYSPFFDVIFFYFSDRFIWIPLYLLLFIAGISKLKWKVIYLVLAIIGLIFMSDKISVYFFKDFFMRLRPCYNEAIANTIHLVGNCGGKYGFVSSHAANTFALAVFSGLFLKKHYPTLLKWSLVWATVVSYSRIYLGVHYPGDVIVGALLGVLIAILMYVILKQLNSKMNLNINI